MSIVNDSYMAVVAAVEKKCLDVHVGLERRNHESVQPKIPVQPQDDPLFDPFRSESSKCQ